MLADVHLYVGRHTDTSGQYRHRFRLLFADVHIKRRISVCLMRSNCTTRHDSRQWRRSDWNSERVYGGDP